MDPRKMAPTVLGKEITRLWHLYCVVDNDQGKIQPVFTFRNDWRGGTATVPSQPFKYMKNVYSTRFLLAEVSPGNRSHSTRPDDPPHENDGGTVNDSSVCHTATLMPVGTMPVTALVSLPGSGNTWCRHLIESVTGIYTGSLYVDKALVRGGFLGEVAGPYTGQTAAVKMHMIEEPKKIDRTVFLVRDLYDAMLAEFIRQQGERSADIETELNCHTHVPDSSVYNKTDEFFRVVAAKAGQWLMLVRRITNNFSKNNKLLVVYFDDLKTDLEGQLQRIVKFLGLPLDNERLKCTLHNAEGNFHRPPQNLSINPFTKAMTQRIESTVKSSQRVMLNHGLPKLRLNSTSPRFSP